MPRYVIKPSRDVDCYVYWSTVIDGPLWMANRDAALEQGIPPERLDKADQGGSSSPAWIGGWDDTTLMAAEDEFDSPPRVLLREHLAAYAELVLGDRFAEALALTMSVEE